MHNNYYAVSRHKASMTTWNQNRILKRYVILYMLICSLPFFAIFITSQYATDNGAYRNSHYRTPVEGYSIYLDNTTRKEINYDKVARVMNLRRKHLQQKCHEFTLDVEKNDSLHRPNTWEFLINRKHRIIWCNVFKAASTSWMYNFNILAGYKETFLKKTHIVPLILARKRYPRPSLEQLHAALNDSISFLIVRHPFERLLSAYRDKIEYSLPSTYHQRLGREIITKYRLKTSKIKRRTPTFEEFIRYLFDSYRTSAEMDMHWTPITNFCTPCLIDFDVIAKFESLWDDQKYLLKITGLENVIKPQWKNLLFRKTSEIKDQYYKQLTKRQIMDIYNIYRYDFELFNYTTDGYLEHGMDSPESTDSPK